MSITPSPLTALERVNNHTLGEQINLSTTKLANGDVIAVWESPPADYNGMDTPLFHRVVLQRFGASGNETGPEVEIFTNPLGSGPGNPLLPKVTALADGGYAVAHLAATPSGFGWVNQVVVRLFGQDGDARATTVIANPQITLFAGTVNEIQVTTYPGAHEPVSLGTGGVAAVWTGGYHGAHLQYAAGQTNYIQHIGSDGTLDGPTRSITPVSGVTQTHGDWVEHAAPMEGGGYVVIYSGGVGSPGNATDQRLIMAQTFDNTGAATGQPFVIFERESDGFGAPQAYPSIAALRGGGFVVAWHDILVGVQAQRFDADFAPQGGMFAPFPPEFGVRVPTVSATPDGGFILTQSEGGINRSFRFDADGEIMGAHYEVPSTGPFPVVSTGRWEFAANGSPLFFVTGTFFGDAYDPADQNDVWVQRYRPEIFGSAGNDTLTASDIGMDLHGLGGDDRLEGGAGNDMLYGGDGTDTLIGGDGDDFLYGGSSAADLRDVIFGGNGNDYIDGGYGNDELLGGNGNDTILGDFGSDTLIGNAGDDLLSGGPGADVLFGGPGNDTLNGGFGFDRLVGGAGADRFFHQGVASHGSDWIQDYNAIDGDVLVFGQAGATRAQFQVNIQTTPGAGSGDVAEAFVIYRPTSQILWALVDGAGQSSINIQLGGQVFDLMA